MLLGMRIYPECHQLECLLRIVHSSRPPYLLVMHTSQDGGQTCDGTRVRLS
jgi:hypothetical protein